MKRTTQFFGLALAGALALLLPLQTNAACGTPTSFGSYYSMVTGTAGGPALRANFWALGSGAPAIGAGNDNGNVTALTTVTGTVPWLVPYPSGQTATWAVLSTWSANSTYDGCPDAAQPDTALQRMVMSFSDLDAQGNMTYAVACAGRDATAGTQFDFTRTGNAPIALVPAQKANITNTVRAGNEATITIGVPNFAPGFYVSSKGPTSGCDPATVIPQFDVYKQQTTRNTPPALTNDAAVGGPWALVATCNTSGSPACTVTTTCGTTNCDNYLAVVPHYNSNFTTAEAATGGPPRVSARSTNVQAGPTLAVTPRPKAIPNPRVESPRTEGNQ